MKAWGSAVLVSAVALAAACGSSHSENAPPARGGSGGSGGKGGASSGRGGSAGDDGGTDGATGGSANAGRGGSGTGGSGARGGKGGRGGTGQGGDAAEAGTGDAGGSDSGGTSDTGGVGGTSGGVGGVAGSAATSGDGPAGGVGGDAGGPAGSGGDGGSAGAPVPTTVTLTVTTSAGQRAISPLIYGVNPGAIACDDPSARFTLCRLGGNRWSTYNWETNASNGGSELCFQNDGALGSSNTPGEAVTSLVDEANTAGATTLVTIPVLDYVAADKLGGSAAPDCSGDVRDTPSYLSARFDQNVAVKGTAFVTAPDTADDYVYQDEFVSFLKDQAGSANVLFALDNQPALWHLTHAPIHPDHPGYDEVVNRNVTFAKAIRDEWPEAKISGYVGYGWADFISLQNSDEGLTKGTFIDYYLDGLEAASNTDGRPLIDYLDVHWYSEIYASGERVIYNGTTPELVAARVQAARSFWDPTYVEDSWVASGSPVQLLPWLEQRLALHYTDYPATELAISEWNLGGGNHISGAVAAADTLGVFGREGVGLAAWVSVTNDDPFVVGAFQAFRNYDGAGAAFGDTSVSAASSDIAVASVYASVDALEPNRVVIVAINRAGNTVTATLNVTDPQTFATADVYALTSASPTPSAAPALAAGAGNTFTYEMPAYSVSVLVPKP